MVTSFKCLNSNPGFVGEGLGLPGIYSRSQKVGMSLSSRPNSQRRRKTQHASSCLHFSNIFCWLLLQHWATNKPCLDGLAIATACHCQFDDIISKSKSVPALLLGAMASRTTAGAPVMVPKKLAVVSSTSSIPQYHIGNYFGLSL